MVAGQEKWLLGGLLRETTLPAFAESPVRKGGDECEKGIHRSLLTAIASATGVGEGGSASAGSAKDVKMPRAPVLRSRATAEGGASRGASLHASSGLSQ